MSTTGSRNPSAEEQCRVPRDVARNYRRLLSALVSRARSLGARNPEDAAQEALKRSLESPNSQAAMEYYFRQELPAGIKTPEWSLDQLLAWLHGVLFNVIREDYSRASTQRETASGSIGSDSDDNRLLDPPDPKPDQLHVLIQRDVEKIVVDCFPKLEQEYRTVLEMRLDGLKYGEIAVQLGVSENTVATWISRAIRKLTESVRQRTEHLAGKDRRAAQGS
jgi:RNA polymerase sigma factor (sigma-70 family)